MAWPVSIEANKVLLQEGEVSHSMYLLQEGQLVVTRKDGDNDVILGYIFSGELVGELSFLDQGPRSATVRAITDCKLMQIPLRTIEEIFKDAPRWVEVLVKTLANRIRETDAKIKV